MKTGDRVEVIAPHPESGAIGVVTHIYGPNATHDRRARVEFHSPYGEGFQVIAARMLRVVVR